MVLARAAFMRSSSAPRLAANSAVTLAGYVEVDGNEYVFAIMANRINPTERSRELARRTIDKMLAKIAKPNTYTQEG